MKHKIQTVLAIGFLISSVAWVYKINFWDKPVVDYNPPKLAGEVQVNAPFAGQLIVDGGQVVKIQWPTGKDFISFSINLPVGQRPLSSIRLDPAVDGSGVVSFRNLKFIDGKGKPTPIRPVDWDSLNAKSNLRVDGNTLVVSKQSPDQYPALLLKIPGPLDTAVDGYTRITKFGFWMVVLIIAAFSLLLLLVLIKCWWQASFKDRLILGGCLLLLIGIRWMTIHYFGFASAFWDYWQFPWSVYFPFEDGNLSWRSLFAPVNEHRIFFSRISSLACYLINGQWDNRFEAMFNSLFVSFCAWGLVLALWRACGKRFTLLISMAAVVCFSLPFAWENTVWANQSCFYFFLGGSLLVFWLLGLSKPFSVQWWLGCSAAFWVMFTVGSGMMAVITVAGLSSYRLLRSPKSWRKLWPTLVASLTLAGLNYPFMVHQTNYWMKTKTFDQFIFSFGKTMSWPFIDNIWIWVLLWLPVIAFFIMAFRSRQGPDRLELWVAILAGWNLLNALGVSILRGGFSSGPISRYMDLSAVAALSGFLALVWLWNRGFMKRCYVRIVASLWLIVMGYGILAVTVDECSVTLAPRMRRQHSSVQKMTSFLLSDNIAFLLNPFDEELPHPNRLGLVAYLRSQRIQAILPSSVRKPLRIEVESREEFNSPGIEPPMMTDRMEQSWGSYGSRGFINTGSLRARILDHLQFSWLEFPVMHRLGGAFDTFLQVRDLERGVVRSVASMAEPFSGWRRLPVKPSAMKNLAIVAQDNDNVAWFAFRAPREKSAVSVWADSVLARSLFIAWSGMVLVVIGSAQVMKEHSVTSLHKQMPGCPKFAKQ